MVVIIKKLYYYLKNVSFSVYSFFVYFILFLRKKILFFLIISYTNINFNF